MATQSSILAWRIQWTEEPGGLQSVDLQESDMTEATKQQSLFLSIMKVVGTLPIFAPSSPSEMEF